MATRTCIIHIGTHKTGTTALQLFVLSNHELLARLGIGLLHSGRMEENPFGNHALPWHILTPDKTETALAEFVGEMRTNTADTMFVTAEDFSLFYALPQPLETLAKAVRLADREPKILVYLRPQAAYAESMYVERVKHGYVVTVSEYVKQCLERGAYTDPGIFTAIEFKYSRFLEPWVRAFGRENVIIRNYEAGKPSEFIFGSLLSVLADFAPEARSSTSHLRIAQMRPNESLNYAQLLEKAYQTLVPGGDRKLDPRVLVPKIGNFPKEWLTERFALFTRDEWLEFLGMCAEDNARVERDYGIHIAFQTPDDVPPADDPRWKKAHVQRGIYDRLIEIWREPARL
jgi:hypothetical protein